MIEINKIVQEQNIFFRTNQTKDIKFRIKALKKLKCLIIENEKEIITALTLDLKKPEFESFTGEIFPLDEDNSNKMISTIFV